MAKSDEILTELRSINVKLYGEGNFEGDIPEIKGHLKKLNGHLDDHSYRITTLETQRKPSRKQVVGSASGVISLLALLILCIGQTLGWWTIPI